MSILAILNSIFIGPIKFVFEAVYTSLIVLGEGVLTPGSAIVGLSVFMNILILPLYVRADAMQREARETEAKLHEGVAHIKKTFSGNERMMMLQMYYWENHYKPTDALKGMVSLLLQIPFFIAAYQFLSGLTLDGVPFGPLVDLNKPDGLLVLGGFTINILPILMTLINFVASALYLKGADLKSKIQVYGIAVIFLILLYPSPSCLVFYWTLNNVFSLVKNLFYFYKIKISLRTIKIIAALFGGIYAVWGALYCFGLTRYFIILVGISLCVPFCIDWLKEKNYITATELASISDNKAFMISTVFLTILVGAVIPSTVIAASAQEFIDVTYYYNPVWYIVNALCLAFGTFFVWFQVFFRMSNAKGKFYFERLAVFGALGALVDYMFFGRNLGIISADLQYDNGLALLLTEKAANAITVLIIAIAVWFLLKKWRSAIISALLVAVVALSGISITNIVKIKASLAAISPKAMDTSMPYFRLSPTGKNVIVLMLDGALGELVPYIFNEKPELQEQFSGFTWYANTMAFSGGCTQSASPALLGGYEYTTVEMNKRDTELLVEKHNEALKMLPVLFDSNNYEVTVCDPLYANYQDVPDLSLFDDCPNIKAYITTGKFSNESDKQTVIDSRLRNFFYFSLMKCSPLFVQPIMYNRGAYNQSERLYVAIDTSISTGIRNTFLQVFDVLRNLPSMTRVVSQDVNTYLFMANSSTHDTALLEEPDYLPALHVDNREYDALNVDRFIVNGVKLNTEKVAQMEAYHVNMASMIQLGKWFNYMREYGVYDNTRIILVADHGKLNLGMLDSLNSFTARFGTRVTNIEGSYPLLMCKDFNSTGFMTSNEFMTNADVPTLAIKDLIKEPINPFTGKIINNSEKFAHEQFVLLFPETAVQWRDRTTFVPSPWASVKNDMRKAENWTLYDGEYVLKEHAAPNQ